MKKSYKNIVIGGGLEGLVLATQLFKHQQDVLLLESSQKLGQYFAFSDSPSELLMNSLNNLPANAESESLFQFAQSNIFPTLSWNQQTLEPVHFEKGEFKTFVGFGDKKVPQYDWIQSYLTADKTLLSHTPGEWIDALKNQVQFDMEYNAEVTELRSQDNRITSVMVNGKTEITAQNIYVTTNPLKLNTFIRDHHALNKTFQKLNGSEFWTVLNVDFVHSSAVTDRLGTHVLHGSKEEHPVCLGYFEPQTPQGTQSSHWMVFLTKEEALKPESSGSLYKEIKKQVKRAYPQALEALNFEKISVFSNSHGYARIKLTDDGRLPGYENLWLCSSKYSHFTNPLFGALDNLRERLPQILNNLSNSNGLENNSEKPVALQGPSPT